MTELAELGQGGGGVETKLAELELGGDGAGTELAELVGGVCGVGTELAELVGAELVLGVCGAGTELVGLVQGGGGAETELAELVDGTEPELVDEAEPELGGGHSTRLLTRPPTELLRAGVGGEELVLVAVPRTQSSRCSCLPPIVSKAWRRLGLTSPLLASPSTVVRKGVGWPSPA